MLITPFRKTSPSIEGTHPPSKVILKVLSMNNLKQMFKVYIIEWDMNVPSSIKYPIKK